MTAQHILVPTDFSADADVALEYAMQWARALQARLTLLHVIEPLVVGSIDALPATFLPDLEAKITEIMAAYHARVTAAGVLCDYTMVHGVPFQVIIETACTARADLIIMGTHGRTDCAMYCWAVWQNACIRLAPCPVLVVRAPQTLAPAAQ